MPTLLALHAHPDDEASKGAATVARYSDAGVHTILVTATGGEAGDVLNPAMDQPGVRERLPEIRMEELEEATRIIGFDDVILLGYRDSGMPGTVENGHPEAFVNADYESALGTLVEIVRRERPEVVLGYDEHEWYPHPDHVRVHELSVELYRAAAAPERFPHAGEPWEIKKLYAPVFSEKRIRALHEAMEARGEDSLLDHWLARFDGYTNNRVVSSIHVGPTIGRARDALRAHRTQVDPDGFWFHIPLDVVLESYPYEDFALLASRIPVNGPEDDLFAGV